MLSSRNFFFFNNFYNATNLVAFSIFQLLNRNTHLGALESFSLLSSHWFVYGIRQRFLIIDLKPVLLNFRKFLITIESLVNERRNIMFLNDRNYAKIVIADLAKSVGEYFITESWVGGLLTNFRSLLSASIRFKSYKSKSSLRRRTKRILVGLNGLRALPSALFFSSAKTYSLAIKEARILKIPSAALVDTDTHGYDLLFPLPGNDESFSVSFFFSQLMAKVIVLRKIFRASKFKYWQLNYKDKLKKQFRQSFFKKRLRTFFYRYRLNFLKRIRMRSNLSNLFNAKPFRNKLLRLKVHFNWKKLMKLKTSFNNNFVSKELKGLLKSKFYRPKVTNKSKGRRQYRISDKYSKKKDFSLKKKIRNNLVSLKNKIRKKRKFFLNYDKSADFFIDNKKKLEIKRKIRSYNFKDYTLFRRLGKKTDLFTKYPNIYKSKYTVGKANRKIRISRFTYGSRKLFRRRKKRLLNWTSKKRKPTYFNVSHMRAHKRGLIYKRRKRKELLKLKVRNVLTLKRFKLFLSRLLLRRVIYNKLKFYKRLFNIFKNLKKKRIFLRKLYRLVYKYRRVTHILQRRGKFTKSYKGSLFFFKAKSVNSSRAFKYALFYEYLCGFKSKLKFKKPINNRLNFTMYSLTSRLFSNMYLSGLKSASFLKKKYSELSSVDSIQNSLTKFYNYQLLLGNNPNLSSNYKFKVNLNLLGSGLSLKLNKFSKKHIVRTSITNMLVKRPSLFVKYLKTNKLIKKTAFLKLKRVSHFAKSYFSSLLHCKFIGQTDNKITGVHKVNSVTKMYTLKKVYLRLRQLNIRLSNLRERFWRKLQKTSRFKKRKRLYFKRFSKKRKTIKRDYFSKKYDKIQWKRTLLHDRSLRQSKVMIRGGLNLLKFSFVGVYFWSLILKNKLNFHFFNLHASAFNLNSLSKLNANELAFVVNVLRTRKLIQLGGYKIKMRLPLTFGLFNTNRLLYKNVFVKRARTLKYMANLCVYEVIRNKLRFKNFLYSWNETNNSFNGYSAVEHDFRVYHKNHSRLFLSFILLKNRMKAITSKAYFNKSLYSILQDRVSRKQKFLYNYFNARFSLKYNRRRRSNKRLISSIFHFRKYKTWRLFFSKKNSLRFKSLPFFIKKRFKRRMQYRLRVAKSIKLSKKTQAVASKIKSAMKFRSNVMTSNRLFYMSMLNFFVNYSSWSSFRTNRRLRSLRLINV